MIRKVVFFSGWQSLLHHRQEVTDAVLFRPFCIRVFVGSLLGMSQKFLGDSISLLLD
jgi:hypothetical protein